MTPTIEPYKPKPLTLGELADRHPPGTPLVSEIGLVYRRSKNGSWERKIDRDEWSPARATVV
ncbi:MAG: hypothetical protein RIB60_07530 [Phycisphaerales bacterium]